MLPYTTYHIPESNDVQTENSTKWLWLVILKPLSEQENDLLQKIAAALKADYGRDVSCLVQDAGKPISISSVSALNPKLVISFGIPPADLGLWIDLNRPGICILESISIILTLPLDALSNNAGAKKELWKCMQTYLELI